MTFCGDYHFLEGVRIINFVITVLKIVIPILLIIFGTFDFVKSLTNPDKNTLGGEGKTFAFRLTSAFMIFLLPSIIHIVFSMVGNVSDTLLILNDCLKNANKGYIEQLKIAKKRQQEELQAKTQTYKAGYNSSKYANKSTSSKSSTSSGSSQNINNGDILEIAQRLWQTVVNGDFTYDGTPIPPTDKIDCSGFVSWILYEYGYQDEFNYQHSTQQFYTTNWNEKFGWEEVPVGAGEDVTSKLQPGDILVRDDGSNNGHMNITVSAESGKVMAYDCGSENNWRNSGGNSVDKTRFAASDSRPGKIIRVTSPSA